MTDQKRMLTKLKEEFERWENVLSSLSETQATTLRLPNGWSVKDLTAHLMAWQRVSVARLEAARLDKEPLYPDWLSDKDPDSETEINRFNARIDERYREQSWLQIHQAWRDGFVRFLELADAVPEHDLEDKKKYPWLKGHSLSAVLEGSYEHHHEDHLQTLLTWVDQHENV